MNPLNIIYGVVSVAIFSSFGWYVWQCEESKDFKDKAVMLAEQARDSAIATTMLYRQSKEKADAELKKLRAANNSLDQRLRDERARSRSLSRVAIDTSSPDTACFQREKLERAISGFVEGTATLVGRGQQAVGELGIAQDWAAGLK